MKVWNLLRRFMAVYGYARVSTIDQDLAIQEAALKEAGCTVIRIVSHGVV